MQEYACHAQRIRNLAGMLARGAAEAVERVLGDVVAALHGNLFDRVGHVFDGDAQKSFRDVLG